MSGRILKVGGIAAAAGAGYYLYTAGGDPKVAEKQLEHDAARLSSKVKSELPGIEKEAKTQGKVWGEQAGQKIDSAVNQAKAYGKDAEKKAEELRKETGTNLNKAVDKFDNTVEKGAAQTKSWIGSWFGGK